MKLKAAVMPCESDVQPMPMNGQEEGCDGSLPIAGTYVLASLKELVTSSVEASGNGV